MSSVSLKEWHAARGVDVVSFIQSRFNQSKSDISRDHFEFFSQSIVINLCQHGEAQEKAWVGKVRTSINSVFATLWWKCFGGVVLNRSEWVWLIVAGRGSRVHSRGCGSKVAVAGPKSRSRVQCRGRGSNVAVAGPKSRSRVQCRGRGKWFGVRGNWVKTSDMKKI